MSEVFHALDTSPESLLIKLRGHSRDMDKTEWTEMTNGAYLNLSKQILLL